ncbi:MULTISPECIES: Uma2 family endonuclease [unclassified Nostoc]|uniref:Uma2 family endonuclease n=1 Tax=unclassified Nostoc TaxID=2593658 RepID=UPI0025AB3B9D|nr:MULTISPECIES: Uma2 family endonuclease [unclassified Nostoc]MDM9580729.1 Uma2 family endonuclease [Nostoc sp. GT001]MDZ7947189.1 Uma2 family endonuclease [Nostoc sp. EfeVER01]MDZ7994668.1 Uma2 family endonuclease [Nostoc sp. EspVER01]
MVTTPVTSITFEEYLTYDDGNGSHYELVDGKLELRNPPTIEHFLIASFLDTALEAEIKRCNFTWLCFRESGVRTGRNKSRLTDLCVVTLEQARELLNASAVFESPPLLIVEVVSPESVKRDYRYKRSEYAVLEVPEYWIVDPLKAKISVLLLEDGFYEETVFTATEQIVSQTFPELAIAVDRVFTAGNLNQGRRD